MSTPWPKRTSVSTLEWLVVAANMFGAGVSLIVGEWHSAFQSVLIAFLFWAWASARRESEFLNASIRYAATEARFRS